MKANTLAITAAFLVPLIAFVGCAVDISRMYVVKTRLQQACDAGVLAGRKSMTDMSASTPLDSTATAQAQAFFTNNFRSGWFGTTSASFTPAKTTDSQVSGTATTTVPLTLMKYFGLSTPTISVTCEARYDVADADIMFVLDTTGSMACTTADGTGGCSQSIVSYTRNDNTTGYYVKEKTGSKLSALRSAVLSFYDTLAANIDDQTHVRYGFVTYTSTVNAGRLLPSNYIVDTWSYQSRKVVGDTNVGSASTKTYRNTDRTTCNSYAGRTPAGTLTYNTNGTAVVTTSSFSGTTCTVTSQTVQPTWSYAKWPFSVAAFKTSYDSGTAVADPSKITGATSKWQGCLEERDTTVASSFDYQNLPPDLDPDLVPTDDSTKWRPMWPDVIYYRGSTADTDNYSGSSTDPYGDTTSTATLGNYTNLIAYNNIAPGYVSCGLPATKLATMTRAQVSAYVNNNDLRAQGGTYHDTGMIWGTRLISPTGIFKDSTAAWPNHNPPNRYIVFMTDGDMTPNDYIYGMYGVERYDQRVSGGSYSSLTAYHNARFVAECSAAKARGISVFVVSFGQTLTTELSSCASPGQAYYASDNSGLTSAFQSIANQVAMLRISK